VDQLTLPIDFESVGPESPQFRRLHCATVHDRALVLAAAGRAWDEHRFDTIEDSPLTRSGVQKSAEGAALWVRAAASSGMEPIEHAVMLLRHLGAVVGELPEVGAISAFSCWYAGTPVVLVRRCGSGRNRIRFDTAHELGHLILHRALPCPSPNGERQANQFAGSLLLPESIMRRRVARPLDWRALVDLSSEFGVTFPAVLARARELDLISPIVYRAAVIESARRGWRRPGPADAETSELIDEVAI
jgi:Zn-dependent peptidase ImmA (M78 family)